MNVYLSIANSLSKQEVDLLVDIINEVYQKSENDIWINNHNRISKERLKEVIKSKELIIATYQKEICGCIHLEKMTKTAYKFKMLVAHPIYKSKGIGSLLVEYAENQAIAYGATIMQLELLVPTEFIHPDKVFLHNWYSRIGYIQKSEHEVDYVHQGIAKFLKVNCVAKVYEKKLS